MRLIYSKDDTFSRLEVCHDGQYGTVCGDSARRTIANVVCRELGFAASGVLYLKSKCIIIIVHFSFMKSSHFIHLGAVSTIDSFEHSLPLLPIFLDDVQCTGMEDRLMNCVHNGFGNPDCTHSQDLAIECLSMSFFF